MVAVDPRFDEKKLTPGGKVPDEDQLSGGTPDETEQELENTCPIDVGPVTGSQLMDRR